MLEKAGFKPFFLPLFAPFPPLCSGCLQCLQGNPNPLTLHTGPPASSDYAIGMGGPITVTSRKFLPNLDLLFFAKMPVFSPFSKNPLQVTEAELSHGADLPVEPKVVVEVGSLK